MWAWQIDSTALRQASAEITTHSYLISSNVTCLQLAAQVSSRVASPWHISMSSSSGAKRQRRDDGGSAVPLQVARGGKPSGSGAGLTVATDFSGIDTPLIALTSLGVAYRHMFSCESNKACRKIIEHCHSPKHMYTDVVGRDVASMPGCKLFVFGFPCQPFSRLGPGNGVNDSRGLLVDHSLQYIAFHKPTAILAENVSTLPTKHKALMNHIINKLHDLGYRTEWAVLNSMSFGIPQSRPRWYLTGILEGKVRPRIASVFPDAYPSAVPLASLISILPQGQWHAHPTKGTTAYNHAMAAYEKCQAKGMNPFMTPVVVDIGCSTEWQHSRINGSPCLTRSRSSSFGYWCSTKGGRLATADMSRLMGFEEIDWRGAGVTAGQYAGCLGNAMAVNVLKELLPNLLFKAKLATKAEVERMRGVGGGL